MSPIESAVVGDELGAALSTGRPANLSRFRHRWLVEGLHAKVHGSGFSEMTRRTVAVRWGDGTMGEPFDLLCRPLPAAPDLRERRLRVGLNSGRHPGLDRWVAFYLLRNREVEAAESEAEQEALAFRSAWSLLAEKNMDGQVLEIFQTGLEPLVVGFYRAVVAVARERTRAGRAALSVVPRIWIQAKFPVHGDVAVAAAAACQAHPNLLAAVPIDDAVMVHWRPERPMIEEEQDELSAQFPALSRVIVGLFKRSEFRTLPTWA